MFPYTVVVACLDFIGMIPIINELFCSLLLEAETAKFVVCRPQPPTILTALGIKNEWPNGIVPDK